MNKEEYDKCIAFLSEEWCGNCADFKSSSGKHPLDTDMNAHCGSEELPKHHIRELPGYACARTTQICGCRIFRKKHSIATLANCVAKQLREESLLKSDVTQPR
jgi:hypothetical protein